MAFAYYKSVTIAAAQCGASDSSNFPVAIWVTDGDFATIANGGKSTDANGYGIRPYADSGASSPLTFELVPGTYVATTGAFEMHVKIPTVSHTSDTVFYLFLGDAAVNTDGSSTATWSNGFQGVWHLPNGSSLTVADSTANANNGTNNGAAAVAGELDGAGSFDNSSTYIDVGNGASLEIYSGFTMTAWVNPLTYHQTSGFILAKDLDTGARGYGVGVNWNGAFSDSFPYLEVSGSAYMDGSGLDATNDTRIHDSAWSYLAFWEDTGPTWFAQVNNQGTPHAPFVEPTPASANTNAHWYIGGRQYSGFLNPFGGYLDEVRIANTVRSADWLTTEYNNQKPSSTFLTFGALTPTSTGKRFLLIPN